MPVASHKLLPIIGLLKGGGGDGEATEYGAAQGTKRGDWAALPGGKRLGAAADPGRVHPGDGLSPQTRAAGAASDVRGPATTTSPADLRRGGAPGADAAVGGGRSDLRQAAQSSAAGADREHGTTWAPEAGLGGEEFPNGGQRGDHRPAAAPGAGSYRPKPPAPLGNQFSHQAERAGEDL